MADHDPIEKVESVIVFGGAFSFVDVRSSTTPRALKRKAADLRIPQIGFRRYTMALGRLLGIIPV